MIKWPHSDDLPGGLDPRLPRRHRLRGTKQKAMIARGVSQTTTGLRRLFPQLGFLGRSVSQGTLNRFLYMFMRKLLREFASP